MWCPPMILSTQPKSRSMYPQCYSFIEFVYFLSILFMLLIMCPLSQSKIRCVLPWSFVSFNFLVDFLIQISILLNLYLQVWHSQLNSFYSKCPQNIRITILKNWLQSPLLPLRAFSGFQKDFFLSSGSILKQTSFFFNSLPPPTKPNVNFVQ